MVERGLEGDSELAILVGSTGSLIPGALGGLKEFPPHAV